MQRLNFYHPIANHQRRIKRCLQWLNYPALLRHLIKQSAEIPNGELVKTYFFSALAKHRNKKNPGTTERHMAYINALKNEGVEVVLGNFKRRPKKISFQCHNNPNTQRCDIEKDFYEEKETDVRIACKLLEAAFLDEFDTCLLLSADSDLVAPIETLKRLYSDKKVVLVTPPAKSKISKLQNLSYSHVKISRNNIEAHQFPDAIPSGNAIIENPWANLFNPIPAWR